MPPRWRVKKFVFQSRKQSRLVTCLQMVITPFQSTESILKCWLFLWNLSRGQLKCDGTRAETRFHVWAKRTSPFKSAVARQINRLLAVEVCASAVVMLDAPCSEIVWKVLATHCIRQFPPTSLPLPCFAVCHHIWTGLWELPYVSRNIQFELFTAGSVQLLSIQILLVRRTFLNVSFVNPTCAHPTCITRSYLPHRAQRHVMQGKIHKVPRIRRFFVYNPRKISRKQGTNPLISGPRYRKF